MREIRFSILWEVSDLSQAWQTSFKAASPEPLCSGTPVSTVIFTLPKMVSRRKGSSTNRITMREPRGILIFKGCISTTSALRRNIAFIFGAIGTVASWGLLFSLCRHCTKLISLAIDQNLETVELLICYYTRCPASPSYPFHLACFNILQNVHFIPPNHTPQPPMLAPGPATAATTPPSWPSTAPSPPTPPPP